MMDMTHNSTEASCSMSMLWNWSTIDACFLSSDWHITSRATFAASCVGLAVLAVAAEALRRMVRDYDTHVLRQLAAPGALADVAGLGYAPRRATAGQQGVRAALHVVHTAMNFVIMLVVMTFNGYAIISILIGTGVGKFFCDWMALGVDDAYAPCPQERGEVEAKLPRGSVNLRAR